jgi:hypothetical protein
MVTVVRVQVVLEVLGNRSRSQDRDAVGDREPVGHDPQEATEVLESARLTGGLRTAAPATVADAGVVSHVPRRASMRGDVGFDPLDDDLPFPSTDDHGFASIDPDQGVGHAVRGSGHGGCLLRGSADSFACPDDRGIGHLTSCGEPNGPNGGPGSPPDPLESGGTALAGVVAMVEIERSTTGHDEVPP